MMVRRPALLLLVPDERGEIDHPGDLEIVGHESEWLRCCFFWPTLPLPSSRYQVLIPSARARCAQVARPTNYFLCRRRTAAGRRPRLQPLAQRLAALPPGGTSRSAGELVRLDLDPGQPLGAEAADELPSVRSRLLPAENFSAASWRSGRAPCRPRRQRRGRP